MNFTRKRALLACDFCRHRKRRCDGEKPCSTCRESNADCHYKDLPTERVESPGSSSEAVAERLGRIENLLEEQGHRLNDLLRYGVSATVPTTISFPPLYLPPELASQSPATASARLFTGQETVYADHQFLIPQDHSTSANSLLTLPQVRFLVGDYPRSYFLDIEAALPLPPQLDVLMHVEFPAWASLNPGYLDSLAENYFSIVHPNHPLFTRQTFLQWKLQVYSTGPSETLQTAICYCVWALGAIASKEHMLLSPEEQSERDKLAMNFFQPALRMMLSSSLWAFKPSLELCKALLLAGSIFAHLGRPLHNAKLVLVASRHFLHHLDDLKRNGTGHDFQDNVLRVFWACFMMECDRAAELPDLPRSGLEPMADRMSLPRSMDSHEGDDLIYFVAETAIRRLLNRIHSSLYSADHSMDLPGVSEGSGTPSTVSLAQKLSLSVELNRQLEEWYHSIPGKLRPPIGTEHISSDRGRILRLRYYDAKHIIHRPFVLYVAMQQMRSAPSPSPGPTPGPGPSQTPPPVLIPRVVIDKCEACISSSITYLYNAAQMLDRRSPYLWNLSQSCMACVLVLLVADTCPQLRPFTPEIKPLRSMVLSKLRRWAAPRSSFEAVVTILESLTITEHF